MHSDEDKELKQLWTKYSEAASQSRLSQKEIAAMVEQVIAQPIRKMRIGLFSDIFCSALACSWFTYNGLQNLRNLPVILPSVLVMAGCIYSICARVRALHKLQRIGKQTPEMILQTLRKSIDKMDRENRKYVRGFLAVVFSLCALILSKIFLSHYPYFSVLGGSNSAAFWGLSTAIAAGLVSAYAYARWYRRHFYRKPMERMQKAVREIEKEN
jgi:hypothetical protein